MVTGWLVGLGQVSRGSGASRSRVRSVIGPSELCGAMRRRSTFSKSEEKKTSEVLSSLKLAQPGHKISTFALRKMDGPASPMEPQRRWLAEAEIEARGWDHYNGAAPWSDPGYAHGRAQRQQQVRTRHTYDYSPLRQGYLQRWQSDPEARRLDQHAEAGRSCARQQRYAAHVPVHAQDQRALLLPEPAKLLTGGAVGVCGLSRAQRASRSCVRKARRHKLPS